MGGVTNFLVNSSQVYCVEGMIILSLLDIALYVVSKPVCGLALYKLRNNVLTSSLKLSVLCLFVCVEA